MSELPVGKIVALPAPEPPKLPAWALEVARQAVVLRENKKHSMLVVRFDGLAWQVFVAAPAVKVTE